MMHKGFWRDDNGQDLIEYALLLAMVCVGSAGLILGSAASITGIWGVTTNNLAAANTAAGS